ncbi:unnamed protein product [Orchesella dallaii]|uniref:NAD(P)(+)--arginine ADP-ribosyltransferase n=1 Tax=Orchesella dallaii TaxID=48710 RepID=A0ABP1PM20_9HEXA
MSRYGQIGAISVSVCVCFIFVILAIAGVSSQETTSRSPSPSNRTVSLRPHHHHHKLHRHNGTRHNGTRHNGTRHNGTRHNETLIKSENGPVNLTENDKYDNYYDDSDDYTYTDDATTESDDTEPMSVEEDDKFIETENNGIVSEHVDFVLLRLKHISMRTTSNITELLALQEEEFQINQQYKLGWLRAAEIFNASKRDKIFGNTSADSIVRTVPEEYHIAVVGYTLNSLYSEFNKDTREVCSGTDIDNYSWKSYFKLLQLAIETLGSQEERWRDSKRFLYRGASHEYVLNEDQVVAFQHFVSTSAALTTAENFAGKTLFEFEGYYNGTAMAVWDHSYYEFEREVLFSPLQVFRVDSIHVGSHYTRYVLVKHQETPTSTPSAQQTSRVSNEDLTTNSLHAISSGIVHGKSFMMVMFLMSCIIIISNEKLCA